MPQSSTRPAWQRRLATVARRLPPPAQRSLRQAWVAVEAGRAAARGVDTRRDVVPKTRRRIGMVEKFNPRQISGWVADEAENLPVRVTLHVNRAQVAATWAGEPFKHNSFNDVRAFHFKLRDLWTYCTKKDKVTVRIDGVPLPIAGAGTYLQPAKDGGQTVAQLRAKLEAGYVFSQHGRLQLSKKLDTEWQATVIGLYERVSAVVKREFGYDPFVIYGSLLGLVRENGFIGHDVDFDAAYVSKHSAPLLVAAELRDIGLRLVDAGFDVECKHTALHVHDADDPELRIDLFHLYFDDHDELQFPFGIIGGTTIPRSQWSGVVDAKLGTHDVKAPANARAMVEHIYGPSWNVPVAGFNWDRERTKQVKDAWTKDEYREEVYWANFYAHHDLPESSSFFRFVSSRDDIPTTVLDIGCGDGRDTFGFASIGSRAHGIDRSHVGVQHAARNAAASKLDDRLTFSAVDVSDATAVRETVTRLRESAGGGPVLFYLRFFLHSIPEDVQDTLMSALAATSQDGDMLAAEFRTAADEDTKKVYGSHYRRYQDGAAFGQDLRERFGFSDIRFEKEASGLAPYKDEDPIVYRVIAAR